MVWEIVDDEEPESMVSSFGKGAVRTGARTASNLATRAVGLPGDIFSLINEFAAKPISKAITGEEGAPYEQTFLGKAIPTTETHRKGIESLTGDYLKPKNKVEQFADDVIEDATLLFNPSGIAKHGVKLGKATKNLFKSIGANLAGETVKQVGSNDQAGALTKAGSMFLFSILDQEGAAKQIGKLYNQAEKALPPHASVNSKNFTNKLSNLKHSITKGRPIDNLAPSEKFVTNSIDKLEALSKNGKVNIHQAIAQKRSLNEELSSIYQALPGKKDQLRAKNLAKPLNGYMKEIIEDYGKNNLNFLNPYKQADQAFGTIAQSNFLSHWAEKNIKQSPMTKGLLHLTLGPLGMSTAAVGAAALGGAGLAAGTAVPYQATKLAYRIAKSPTLSKIYGNTIKAAVKEDSVLFNKYLSELDKELQKEEGEEVWEAVD